MNFQAQLKQIKKTPYKQMSVEQKFAMINDVLSGVTESAKWRTALNIFMGTRLQDQVMKAVVREHLKKYAYRDDVTFSYKADLAETLVFQFEDFIDVHAVVKEVFGDQYEALLKQIADNAEGSKALINALTPTP